MKTIALYARVSSEQQTERLDNETYPTGVEVTKAEMKKLTLQKDSFHGDWNI
jgi:predicted site-specific integrase-resolvase